MQDKIYHTIKKLEIDGINVSRDGARIIVQSKYAHGLKYAFLVYGRTGIYRGFLIVEGKICKNAKVTLYNRRDAAKFNKALKLMEKIRAGRRT